MKMNLLNIVFLMTWHKFHFLVPEVRFFQRVLFLVGLFFIRSSVKVRVRIRFLDGVNFSVIKVMFHRSANAINKVKWSNFLIKNIFFKKEQRHSDSCFKVIPVWIFFLDLNKSFTKVRIIHYMRIMRKV